MQMIVKDKCISFFSLMRQYTLAAPHCIHARTHLLSINVCKCNVVRIRLYHQFVFHGRWCAETLFHIKTKCAHSQSISACKYNFNMEGRAQMPKHLPLCSIIWMENAATYSSSKYVNKWGVEGDDSTNNDHYDINTKNEYRSFPYWSK